MTRFIVWMDWLRGSAVSDAWSIAETRSLLEIACLSMCMLTSSVEQLVPPLIMRRAVKERNLPVKSPKKVYSVPRLTAFGHVTKLTQGGGTPGNENQGSMATFNNQMA